MSIEIKMVYADVENQLMEMTSKIEAMSPKAEPPISGNTMDVVTKLTELSSKLEQLLTKYQTLLLMNSKTTKGSVEFMRESDEKISSVIQSAVSGPKQEMIK